ncbi:unnamed protein product [Heligmosomoides polygyrus]|uniref:KR domain-containing protein n=1 Tax=Heligmosomoides polygyrus TaxID=6339 RepID=A0A3P7YUN5_HELPZ|nr:unnamed protein product [Heligmosomoides polygyrus]
MRSDDEPAILSGASSTSYGGIVNELFDPSAVIAAQVLEEVVGLPACSIKDLWVIGLRSFMVPLLLWSYSLFNKARYKTKKEVCFESRRRKKGHLPDLF